MKRCPVCHVPRHHNHLVCPGCGYRLNQPPRNRQGAGGMKPEATNTHPPAVEGFVDFRTAYFG